MHEPSVQKCAPTHRVVGGASVPGSCRLKWEIAGVGVSGICLALIAVCWRCCAGLIGWVPNTDTLHSLIREYRDARKIPLNVEHRLMLGMAPDYDHLTVIQKVEVFEHALDSTSGVYFQPSTQSEELSGDNVDVSRHLTPDV